MIRHRNTFKPPVMAEEPLPTVLTFHPAVTPSQIQELNARLSQIAPSEDDE